MKIKGQHLTQAIDALVAKFGSIDKIPIKYLEPFREDFKHDHEPIHHNYFDESELPWNQTLHTHRLKVYKVAKALRILNHKKRLQFIRDSHINQNTAYNVIYQLHLHHRGYAYKCFGHPLIIVSYRQELLDAIKEEHVSGPQSETGLSQVMRNNGYYRPAGRTLGVIRKIIIIRGVTYKAKDGHGRRLTLRNKRIIDPESRR